MAEMTISQGWVVVVGVASALLTLDKIVELFKKWFGKKNTGEAVICRTLLALLNHQLSGNDMANLRKARDELNAYLTSK